MNRRQFLLSAASVGAAATFPILASGAQQQTMVAVHGNGAPIPWMSPFYDGLVQRGFNVMLVVLPGHRGGRELGSDGFSFPAIKSLYENIITAFDAGNEVHLSGWSLGGNLIRLALNPSTVKKVCTQYSLPEVKLSQAIKQLVAIHFVESPSAAIEPITPQAIKAIKTGLFFDPRGGDFDLYQKILCGDREPPQKAMIYTRQTDFRFRSILLKELGNGTVDIAQENTFIPRVISNGTQVHYHNSAKPHFRDIQPIPQGAAVHKVDGPHALVSFDDTVAEMMQFI